MFRVCFKAQILCDYGEGREVRDSLLGVDGTGRGAISLQPCWRAWASQCWDFSASKALSQRVGKDKRSLMSALSPSSQ